MLRRTAARLRTLPRHGLTIAGALAVCAAVAAVVVAVAWPTPRAAPVVGSFAAIASTVGALAAIHLSRQALARTDRQLEESRRSLVLSRYPLLLPVHQAVAFPDTGGMVAPHPPAEERYALASAPAPAYAFLALTKDRLVIPVENVGAGPALRVSGTLWCSDGRSGPVTGVPALAAGHSGVLAAVLREDRRPAPVGLRALVADDGGPAVAYQLDLDYVDVFAHARRTSALFDPRGRGAWHHLPGDDPGAH
ncbi:hypothetical protein [Micromonospora humi]|uniref:Uncharacterized protein n=1 Tax=Micromonospora humi TaxID=745366 RepID=A0A1C5IRW1_9ACTN|nr:hypothetical protein [Micromonospora humi]SCG61062.1 hypothetical protein GA0070213_10711 [Micromonospora humi]